MEPDDSTWSLLPADNLQAVFKNLEIFQVEKCLLVCKNWNFEGNFYLKDKICLYPSKVNRTEDVDGSRRRFQKVCVEESTDISILEALMRQHKTTSDPILGAFIEYRSYPSLSRILQTLGKHVKTLNLTNLVYAIPETVEERESIFNTGLQRGFAALDYGCLTSVEDLQIHNLDNGILNISQNFGNLKSLTLKSKFLMSKDYVSTVLLQDFIRLNPLRKLDLMEGNLGLETDGRLLLAKHLISTENNRNLEALHLNLITSNQDLEDIAENFKRLEVLEISELDSNTRFNAKSIRQVFQLPNLRSLSIWNSDSDTSVWQEVFTRLNNSKLTHLTLSDYIEEAALIPCIQSLPNIESFACHNMKSFSLLMFQEMSKNWKNLRTLDLSYNEDSFQHSGNAEFCNFDNLRYLELNEMNLNPSVVPLFTYLKAINLKTLSLNTFCFKYDKVELDKLLALLSENCPNVQHIKFTGVEKDIIAVMPYFPNLRTLDIHNDYGENYSIEVIWNILSSILIFKSTDAPIKVNVHFWNVPALDDFCPSPPSIVEFKNKVLKRISIQNKEILFIEYTQFDEEYF